MSNSTKAGLREEEACDCCEVTGKRLHWMQWAGPMTVLCSECADQAIKEDRARAAGIPVQGGDDV